VKTIDREKDILRRKLEKDIKEFLKRGGKVKKIPVGETGIDRLSGKRVTRQHRKKQEPTST
jgi:hypothetical protein